jgi:hypothetical protein
MEEAREKAIQDIQEELSKCGKCFIAFVQRLNPIMDELVNEQLKAQEKCSINSSQVM